jgi:dienelactone hydrolase
MRKEEAMETVSREVQVSSGPVTLTGNLQLPPHGQGIVLFVHGSGSSRHSPRNLYVARALQALGLGTLLWDLLTEEEEAADARMGRFRFDIQLLAERVLLATEWVMRNPQTQPLRIGYFGASTGAAAALVAAAQQPEIVHAVVSRGGRPDLAGAALRHVLPPTLLIVGEADRVVVELNRQALDQLASLEKDLVLVQGATHLFEEPGALAEVARLAAAWFEEHLIEAEAGQATA